MNDISTRKTVRHAGQAVLRIPVQTDAGRTDGKLHRSSRACIAQIRERVPKHAKVNA